MTGLYFQYQKDQAEKGSQRDSAMARVSEADRAAETLSEATACTLAEGCPPVNGQKLGATVAKMVEGKLKILR